MADSERLVGATKTILGKAEKEVGKAIGDLTKSVGGVRTQAEGVIQKSAGQVTDAAEDFAENISNASADAYDLGSEMVARNPGSALLLAGAIGFALGMIMTQGSRPKRNKLQRYYDRYGG